MNDLGYVLSAVAKTVCVMILGFFFLVFGLRSCITIVSADPIPVYEGFGVYGRPFITRQDQPMIYLEDSTTVIIEQPDSGKGYVDCLHDQSFYAYVIGRYEKEDPVFWAETIELYKNLEEECHL